jgi:hypothetical protein
MRTKKLMKHKVVTWGGETPQQPVGVSKPPCLLYTSDAADE